MGEYDGVDHRLVFVFAYTVYVKTFEGENFRGWTAKWSFTGKHLHSPRAPLQKYLIVRAN